MRAAKCVADLGVDVGQQLRLLRVGSEGLDDLSSDAFNQPIAYFQGEDEELLLAWDEVEELKALPADPIVERALSLVVAALRGQDPETADSLLCASLREAAKVSAMGARAAAATLLAGPVHSGLLDLTDVSRSGLPHSIVDFLSALIADRGTEWSSWADAVRIDQVTRMSALQPTRRLVAS